MLAIQRSEFSERDFCRKIEGTFFLFFTFRRVLSVLYLFLCIVFISISFFKTRLRLHACACVCCVRVCMLCVIWRENTYGQSHRTRIPFGTLFSLQREKRKSGAWERACPHRDGVAHAKKWSQRSPAVNSFTPRESHRKRNLSRIRRVLNYLCCSPFAIRATIFLDS